MSATFQNSAMVLSIGIFFTLIILGLAGSLPGTLQHGLVAQGVPAAAAARVAALPPVSVLFASLLGYNPVQTLLGHVISQLPASRAAYLTGHSFFPALISPSFSRGLTVAFSFAAAMCVIAALASLLRGGKYVHRAPADTEGAQAADTEGGLAADSEGGPAADAEPGRAASLAPGDVDLAPADVGSHALAGNSGPGGRGVSR
jgi:hypothetical protein